MFEHKNIRLGISPIGWSNDDMPELGSDNTFEQCISEIALAGFEGTEVGVKFPEDSVILKKLLKIRGIQLASQWFSSYLCSTSYEENEREFIKTLDFLEKVEATKINICELTHCLFASEQSMFGENKPIATDEEWELLCTGLDKLGKIAKDRGFTLCYHHHMATIVQTVGETKRLLENTNPDYVSLCFDTGHFMFSNEDPKEAAKAFGKRIGHIHLKDIRKEKMKEAVDKGFGFRKSVLEGCFTVPGDGMLDFESILKELNNIGYEGWFIVEAEQNPAIANPFENALNARRFIKQLIQI